MPFFINKNDIANFIKNLSRKYNVIVPQVKDNETTFDFYKEDVEIDINYENLEKKENTQLPPKKFILLPEEILFVYNNKKNKISEIPLSDKKTIIFASINDLKGIKFLDEIMENPIADYFYLKSRSNIILIGIDNGKNGIYDKKIADLILFKNNQNYFAEAISKEGNKILKFKHFQKSKEIIEPVQDKSINQNQNFYLTSLQKLLLDSELLANAIEWSQKNSKIWDELAEICLGCGICAYVCPLCFCFSINDRISLDGKTSIRYRSWDACTLPNFAKIAGGKNFRPTIKKRYYNWFYHKFVRGYKEYGKSLCIGCTRCQKYCPAGIDIEKILTRIVKEYQEIYNHK